MRAADTSEISHKPLSLSSSWRYSFILHINFWVSQRLEIPNPSYLWDRDSKYCNILHLNRSGYDTSDVGGNFCPTADFGRSYPQIGCSPGVENVRFREQACHSRWHFRVSSWEKPMSEQDSGDCGGRTAVLRSWGGGRSEEVAGVTHLASILEDHGFCTFSLLGGKTLILLRPLAVM
jgi:hypothetical protein